MDNQSQFVVLNDEVVLKEQALIPVQTSGLYYGAGCFETFYADGNRIFKFGAHIDRLNNGLIYLGAPKKNQVNVVKIRAQIFELLKANRLENSFAKVRVQISFTDPGGYGVDHQLEPTSYITAEKIWDPKTSTRLATVNTRVVPSSSKPAHLKLSNMLHYRKAWQEAQQLGSEDALMLTTDNYAAETSISNLFWKKNDTIYTPSKDCDILPGIMRNSVIDILKSDGTYRLKEGRYKMDELKSAESVYCTNSVIKIIPVQQIDDVKFTIDQNFLQEIGNQLESYIEVNYQ